MAKADIYVDDQGRRRVDRDENKQPTTDPIALLQAKLAQMETRLAKAEAENATLKSELHNFTITPGSSSVQISGSGPKGIVIGTSAGSDSGGQPYDLDLCNGTIITVTAHNVTPPP